MATDFHWVRRAALLALVAITSWGRHAMAAAAPPAADRVVVMISVDGLCGYYLDDPKAEMPTIRQLAADGVRASSMKASTPTVTWPNHTTLVTGVSPGRHGVMANNYLDRKTRKTVTLLWDPLYDKDEVVKTPTIYDLAKKAELVTAAVRWPATRNAHTIDWNSPDVGTNDLVRGMTTPALLAECKAAGFVIDDNGGPSDPRGRPFHPQDEMWTHILVNILRDHRPNLALLHTVKVDHVEHYNGPQTREAYAAIKEADDQVRQVWDELQKDFPGKATLLVVSDHGFSPIRRAILPNVVLRDLGLVEEKKGKVTGGPVAWVSQGGSAYLYVLDDGRRAEIVDKVKQAFAGVEGISKVIGVESFPEYGVADPQIDPRSPDLILFSALGYNFGDTAAGTLPFDDKPERKGSHGHDAGLPELHATFVACGSGIRRGVNLGEISNESVAPTIARLLGIEMPNVDGKPLDAALAP
jgi:predicted AlkP superfamily pyrophosphatase or phosphodiesterase